MDFRYSDKPISVPPAFIAGLEEKFFIVQSKYDGWRAQIHLNDNIKLFASSGRLLTDRAKVPTAIFTALRDLQLPDRTVLDAEFVGPRGSHAPALYLFDCLAWDGKWLAKVPYADRWNYIISQRFETRWVRPAETVETGFVDHFEKLKREWVANGRGMNFLFEGIVLKRRAGILKLSRNSATKSEHLFKVKFRDIDMEKH